ncbi:sugar phosphate isomerase/epimerase family protein [Yinghuangia aomiensis]
MSTIAMKETRPRGAHEVQLQHLQPLDLLRPREPSLPAQIAAAAAAGLRPHRPRRLLRPRPRPRRHPARGPRRRPAGRGPALLRDRLAVHQRRPRRHRTQPRPASSATPRSSAPAKSSPSSPAPWTPPSPRTPGTAPLPSPTPDSASTWSSCRPATSTSIDEARRLVDLLPDGALKLVVEAWHFFRGPSSWESLRDLPLDLVGFVQFSDAPEPIHDDHHTESMHRRALPGEGVLDLPAFCGALLDKGYDGVVSVELLDDTWRAAPLPDFAEATLRTTRKVWDAAARA